MSETEVDISVVIPCLNEERTIRRCIEAAQDGIRSAGLRGEVIVADNGSTDRSRQWAAERGARIVDVPRLGYGAALQAGFLEAHGRLMVMGDADVSYDFREIPAFVAEQRRTNADIVVGNRFEGGIKPGAMPWSHRLVGNPLISWTIRKLFGSPVGDCYCGLRMITRDAHRRLPLKAAGMEFALEMIVLAGLSGMRVSQVPVTLHVDLRDRAPHLRTVRDGYRSFRLLFMLAPITVYLLPGMALIMLGLAHLLFAASREVMAGAPASSFAPVSAGLVLIGGLMILLGMIARVFAVGFLGGRLDPSLRSFFSVLHLEQAVSIGIVGIVAGIVLLAWGTAESPSLALLGMALLTMAVGTSLGGFVVSLIGRAVPDFRLYPPGEAKEEPPGVCGDGITRPERERDPLALEALASAKRYNAWLLGNLQPAFENASSVLNVGCGAGGLDGLIAEQLRRDAEPGGTPRVVGIELSHGAVEKFRQRHANEKDVQVVEGSILLPPEALIDAAPFDAVVSCDLLQSIDGDIDALKRMGDLLRPGGRLALVVQGGGDRLYGTLDMALGHYRRYTAGRLQARLEEAGFEILRIAHADALGWFGWFVRNRLLRLRRFSPGQIALWERKARLTQVIDRFLGPPFGCTLVAIATRPFESPDVKDDAI